MTEPAEPVGTPQEASVPQGAGAPQEADWAVRLAEAAGEGAEVGDAFGVPVFDVPAERWVATLQAACEAGLSFFDWLSAVDELDEGFSVVAHIADIDQHPVLHLLVRTRLPRDNPRIASVTGIYRGATWHERETHEMFGIEFDGHPNLAPLLLPDGFEGHPLRKEFVLAARAAKPWPGAKEPGEGGEGRAAPSRRRMLPPGVPDPSWGPRRPAPPRSEEPAEDASAQSSKLSAEPGKPSTRSAKPSGGAAPDPDDSGSGGDRS